MYLTCKLVIVNNSKDTSHKSVILNSDHIESLEKILGKVFNLFNSYLGCTLELVTILNL